MAEFNLERIRFRWRGTWTPATAYRKDDIVKYGAKVYVALDTHTSDSVIATDFAASRWEQHSDGEDWKGDWEEFTFYKLDDIVKYRGIVYNCVEEHTSQPDFEAELGEDSGTPKWEVVAATYNWTNLWAPDTFYRLNDVVKFNGVVYICNDTHVSQTGLDDDQAKWDMVTQSDAWKGAWATSTEYRPNDVVRYGANMYRCLIRHTSENTEYEGLESDLGDDSGVQNWEIVYEGVRYRTDWVAGTRYIKNDIVRYEDTLWICIGYNSATVFDVNDWNVWLPGLGYEDTWNASTMYQIGDIVRYGGYTYAAILNNVGVIPSSNLLEQNTGSWEVISVSYDLRGDFDPNLSYRVGDLVYRGGYVYVALRDQTAIETYEPDTDPTYWELLATGSNYRSTWEEVEDDSSPRTYYLGDVVLDEGTSYICINQHVAEEYVNRPKFDAKIERFTFGEERYNEKNVDVSGQTSAQQRIRFSRDGTKMYVADGGDPIYQYTLSTAWDVSTATYDTVSVDPSATNAGFRCFDFTPDGETLIWYGTISDQLGIYNLSTPWDLSTASAGSPTTLPNLSPGDAYDIRFGNNGNSIMALVDVGGQDSIRKYDLGSPYSISSITYDDEFQFNQVTEISGFAFNGYGTKVFVIESDATASKHVYEYTFGTAWDVSTLAYNEIAWVYSEVLPGRAYSIEFKPDGTAAYFIDTSDDTVYQIDNTFNWPSGSIGGDFWEVLVQGSPENVLNALGDIKTYGQIDYLAPAQGDKVLPIGNRGTVLQSLPTGELGWDNYGVIEKTYYVSEKGEDTVFNGTNSAPFRTIKYACDYILSDELNRAPATILVKTGKYDEILPISVPANVAIVGDELRSTVVRPAAGYETSNMFYMRQASGLRNLTVSGLTGELGPQNENFTRRPTAGAFVSLDPGTGPDDTSVHILTRSPYVQNVSTFGTGCIGLKVDGDLHDAGFKSIVANDFTQILSDGIGFWANKDGRSELVSVFTYYCHIGYLTTNGGFVRATNGNNSYGTYGSVAEGFNDDESPITAEFDNQTLEAQVDRVYISNGLKIMGLGFDHTGEQYTSATATITGSGVNVNPVFEEFRDGAISEIRVTEEISNRIGGNNYTNTVNRAIEGDETTIKFSNSDESTAANVEGQRIIIREGVGTGQYGWIQDYNESTQIATIYRETDNKPGWDHIAAGWPIANALDETTSYQILPRVTIDEPTSVKNTRTLPSTADWQDVTISNGNSVAVGTNNVAAYTTDAITWTATTIPNGDYNSIAGNGADLIAVGDAAVAAYSDDAGLTWSDVSIADYFLADEITPTASVATHQVTYSNRSVTSGEDYSFSVFVKSSGYPWVRLVVDNAGFPSSTIAFFNLTDGSVGTTALEPGVTTFVENRDNGWYRVGVQGMTADATTSSQSVSITVCQLDNQASFLGNGTDGIFAWGASFENSSTVTDYPPTANLIPQPEDFTTGWTQSSVTITSDQELLSEATFNYNGVAYGNGTFIAVGDLNDAMRTSDNGTTWVFNELPASASPGVWKDIAFGKDTFVAIAQDTNEAAYSIDDGVTWTSSTLLETADWTSIVYGKGIFVAIATDSNTVAYSDDGITWYSSTLPVPDREFLDVESTTESPSVGSFAKFNVTKVSNDSYTVELWDAGDDYAAGNTVIIAGDDVGGTTPANDITITVTGVSDSSQGPITDFTYTGTPAEDIPEWASVGYDGAGTFYIVAQSYDLADTNLALKSWDGRVWIQEDLPSVTQPIAVAGGEVNGSNQFLMIGTNTNVSSSVFLGSRAFATVYPTSGQLSGFIIHDPGAGYASAPDVTITDNIFTTPATFEVRVKDGCLAQPAFYNRGADYTIATATISGDGFADIYQTGRRINISSLTDLPSPGDSVSINGINDLTYFVVRVESSTGTAPDITAQISISPGLGIAESPNHTETLIIRRQYSQIRLTGHDFLDIGTGNFANTDYPDLYKFGETTLNERQPFNEVVEYDSGRVFYTSTDQDGNFRVGELFWVEQSTGTITVTADFFDLSGLQELRIGGIQVGSTNAVIREFSTDPTFAADSNNVVPTQKAIAAYITSRVSGGGSDARTNVVNAGQITIKTNEITSAEGIVVDARSVNIQGNPDGSLAALSWFLTQGGAAE